MSFREVFRTSDPMRAQFLEALFTAEGVVFRRLGGRGPELGTLLHEYRFEVSVDDYVRAESLIASVASGQSSDLHGEYADGQRQSSWLRRVTPLLVRLWLFVFGGFFLMLPLLLLYNGARAAGLPNVALVSLRDVVLLNMVGGLALAFIPDRNKRNRVTLILVAIMVAVSMLGLTR